jgi:hypothetical protein
MDKRSLPETRKNDETKDGCPMKNVWHERNLEPEQRICSQIEDGLAWEDPSVPSGEQSCPENNCRQREAGFHHLIRWGMEPILIRIHIEYFGLSFYSIRPSLLVT